MDQRYLTTLQLCWQVRETVNDLITRDKNNPLAQDILALLPDMEAEYQALIDSLPAMSTQELHDLSLQAGPGMLRFRCIEIIIDRKNGTVSL